MAATICTLTPQQYHFVEKFSKIIIEDHQQELLKEVEQQSGASSSSGDAYSADEIQFQRSAERIARGESSVDQRIVKLFDRKRKVMVSNERLAAATGSEH